MPAGLASLVLQAQALFTIILGAFVFGERLQGKQLAGIRAGDLRRAGAGGGFGGSMSHWWAYADPGGGAQLGLRQYFQQKNHVPGDPPANHIAGGVERIDPGAAVYVCLGALIDGPQLMLASLRQIDMLTVLSLLYRAFIATSSAMVSGARCWGAMKPGGVRRCRCWCR